MNKQAILCAAGLMCLSAASATEEEMNNALSVWNQQYGEYKAALQFATTEEQRALVKEPDGSEIADTLWKSVSAKTGAADKEKKPMYEFDEPWAAPAVIWFVQHPEALAQALSKKKNPQKEISFYADRLMNALHRVHYANPGVGAACAKLAEGSTAREYEILEKIYSRNQDKNARGCAALGMSLMLSNPLISSIGGSEAEVRAKRVYYLKQSLTLTDDDVMFGSVRLSEVASEQAYRLRHLMQGCVPPQITVKDMGGATVKVLQQGKPHLLLFWAPEEETGASMVQSIDKLAAGNPGLEIVPVTHFATPDAVQQLQEQGISRTCFDDAQGTAARAYRISTLPTVVLVSADCNILYTGAPNMQLQAKIDACTSQQPKKERPRVIVEEKPAAKEKAAPQEPAPLQPMPQPQGDTPPALRDMPQFDAPL